ncbi:MAG: TolC family protein, partial [Lentisphaeria bacterium]|nr:TolC family protein [Lentisphaeria bacterium]
MKRTIFHLCFILLAVFVVSCSSVRSPLALRVRSRKLPEADVVRSFPAESATVSTPDRWWEAFGSEELNDLMERAFRRNLSVASAWTRLRQAQSAAVLASADGKLLLTGTAKAETTKRRTEGGGTGDTDSYNSFQAGLGLSYELDLWGRIHAGTRAAGREIMASEQDVMATALALSGQLTAAWLQHGAAQAELATVRDQIGTSKKSLDLLKVRQRKGMSELVDVLQQQQQVSGLESVVPGLRETIAIQKLQIAYLLGEPADADLGLREGGLPALPGLPATGVPAEILARRPDVQVAWHQLMAQEWAVMAARADRLPTLSLSATVALNSPDIGRIFDNWLATLAANLVAPILDGGRRKAVVNRDRALAD